LTAAAFGLVAAILALGRNHVALLLCFVLVAAMACEIASSSQPLRYTRERLGVMLTMGGIAAVLLAVPLLLTLQFAALSNRPEVTIETSLDASLYPANFASLAVANVFGSVDRVEGYWGPNYETEPDVGATDQSFNYLFIGATPTILLLWFGVAGGWLWRRGNRLMAAAALAAALYAMGRYTPLYGLAFHHIPGIDLFRRPIDGSFVLVGAVALLAGHLLADYVRDGLPRVAPWRVVAVAALGLAVIGWAVVFSARSDHGWSSLLQVMKVVPVVALVVVGLARARTAQARSLAAVLAAVIATGELLWFNTASPLNAEAPGYSAVLQQPTGEEARALAILEAELAKRHQEGGHPRIEVVGVGGAWQNLSVVRGWRRPTATTRYGSAPTTISCLLERPPSSSTSGSFPRRSRATTVPWRASLASSTWCLAGPSRRCRTWRDAPWRRCCWRVPRCGSTGCTAPSRASKSSTASWSPTPTRNPGPGKP
jgi:hypothetical protein